MPNELTRQSEQRRGLVGIEARRSLIVLDQYRRAYDKTDKVTTDGNYSETGLTADFLALNDYSVQRLQEHGIQVPLIPIGTPQHSFHSRIRTAIDHKYAKPFPPYIQEYIDPSSHIRYILSDKTERINIRNRAFFPNEEGFTGAHSFFESAREQREKWNGTVVFDAETGHPHYTDESFTVFSSEINGIDELLCVEEIGEVMNTLTLLHSPLPLDESEIQGIAMLTSRMTAVQTAVELMEREQSYIVKDALRRVAQAIKKADFLNTSLTNTPTRHMVDGKRVYFYPSTAEFQTEEGVSVSNGEYLELSMFALSFLLRKVPKGTLPRDLYMK